MMHTTWRQALRRSGTIYNNICDILVLGTFTITNHWLNIEIRMMAHVFISRHHRMPRDKTEAEKLAEDLVLTPQQIEGFKEAFNAFDHNRDGKIR